MPRFVLRVDELLQDIDGFEGVALAGPVLENDYNLAVGDVVRVPTALGSADGRCTGFPLANWGRRGWVTITVTGVAYEDIAKGALALAEADE